LKIAVLFSGGKDSTYATWVAQHHGWDIGALVTVLPRTAESMMFHFPNAGWTKLQAETMGLQHRVILAGKDELLSLKEGLAKTAGELDIDGIATGAVASDYQKSRIDQICDSLGLRSFAPLWRKDPQTLVSDLKTNGFRMIVSGVGAEGLDKSWLGEELTDQRWATLESLSRKHGIHLTGEGGEYETFVVDAPFFENRVNIEKSHSQWDGQSGYLVIDHATLGHKLAN
jgi:ABC transporter with metal-binding/Fe-S-binding domain ATP-binding protein